MAKRTTTKEKAPRNIFKEAVVFDDYDMIPPREPEFLTDERKGWPSASSMERLMLCSPSFLLESGEREIVTEQSEYGHYLHKALAGEIDFNELRPEEQEFVLTTRDHEVNFALELDIIPNEPTCKIHNEGRLWLSTPGNEWFVSGKYDKLYFDTITGKVLVVDYKTGRSPVTDATQNWQMRTLAILTYLYCSDVVDTPVSEVVVLLIQPWCNPSITFASYKKEDIEQAWDLLVPAVKIALAGKEKRVAGEQQCKHCKAAGKCETAMQWTFEVIPPEIEIIRPAKGSRKKKVEIRLPVPPPDVLSRYLKMVPTVENVCEQWKETTRRVLIAGIEVPSYQMTDPGAKIDFTNVHQTWLLAQKLETLGITLEEFMSCCTLSFASFRALVMKKKNIEREKQARHFITSTFKEFVTITPKRGSLKRIGKVQ